jgi:hypothetical protein
VFKFEFEFNSYSLHIWKHDVYGEKFKQAWRNKIEREIELDELEQELEDDDIYIDYELHALHLD